MIYAIFYKDKELEPVCIRKGKYCLNSQWLLFSDVVKAKKALREIKSQNLPFLKNGTLIILPAKIIPKVYG